MAADLKRNLLFLQQLQRLDADIATLEERLKTEGDRKAAARADYLAAKTLLDAKQQEREIAEKARRSEELELAAELERVRERETKLYAIKTNKEYQAALKEIADAKKANREREDKILKLMETAETAAKESTQLSGEVADKESGCREAIAALEAELTALTAEHDAKTAERGKIIGEVSRDVLRQYEQIRQRYSDAVTTVENGICLGCNMRLPPQQYIELQRWASIAQCPSCHRILCPPEAA
ncbi:MAG: hypothetical protein HYV03_07265 [Deltaproteobacteria bacterium]|nr:hypothetical protein [Deltaproteobacteria bacterium]